MPITTIPEPPTAHIPLRTTTIHAIRAPRPCKKVRLGDHVRTVRITTIIIPIGTPRRALLVVDAAITAPPDMLMAPATAGTLTGVVPEVDRVITERTLTAAAGVVVVVVRAKSTTPAAVNPRIK